MGFIARPAKAINMIRPYEIFERFSDGSTLWRASAPTVRDARNTLKELSTQTKNECYAMNLQTGEVTALVRDHAARAAHA